MAGIALVNRLYENGFGGNVSWTPAGGALFRFPVASWEFNTLQELINVTNTSSGGWNEWIAGVNDGTISLKVFWDENNHYTSAVLLPGALGELVLEVGENPGTLFSFPEVIILSVKMLLSPKTATTWDVDFKVSGPPTYPA
jgi:hypothetical protein